MSHFHLHFLKVYMSSAESAHSAPSPYSTDTTFSQTDPFTSAYVNMHSESKPIAKVHSDDKRGIVLEDEMLDLTSIGTHPNM